MGRTCCAVDEHSVHIRRDQCIYFTTLYHVTKNVLVATVPQTFYWLGTGFPLAAIFPIWCRSFPTRRCLDSYHFTSPPTSCDLRVETTSLNVRSTNFDGRLSSNIHLDLQCRKVFRGFPLFFQTCWNSPLNFPLAH